MTFTEGAGAAHNPTVVTESHDDEPETAPAAENEGDT